MHHEDDETHQMEPSTPLHHRETPSLSQHVTESSKVHPRGQESAHCGNTNETLYTHPNVKIVSFTSSGVSSQLRREEPFAALGEEFGSLPCFSRSERTIAAGPFTIYRTTGSAAFLKCGSALQPVLRKSQCWRVDMEGSKFVLQIRRPQYWRIELPVTTPQEESMARILREVLESTLQFEKTQCPFQRPFTVLIPEQTPTIKRPWKPMTRAALSEVGLPASPSKTSELGGAVATQTTQHGSPDALCKLRDINTLAGAKRDRFHEAPVYRSHAPEQLPSGALSEERPFDDVASAFISDPADIDEKGSPVVETVIPAQKKIESKMLVSPTQHCPSGIPGNFPSPRKSRPRCAAGFTTLYAETLPPHLSLDTQPPATETSSSQEASRRGWSSRPFSSHWPPSSIQTTPPPPRSQDGSLCTAAQYPLEMKTTTALARRKEMQRWASRSTLSIVQRAMLSLPEAVPQTQLSRSLRPNLSTSPVQKFPADFSIRVCKMMLWTPDMLFKFIVQITRWLLAKGSISAQWLGSKDGFDEIDGYGELYWNSIFDRFRGRIQDLPSLDENQVWGVD